MTAFLNEDFHSDATTNVQVWHCESCNCVHIRAGKALLTFTPKEFAAFTDAVTGCYAGEVAQLGSLYDFNSQTDFPLLLSEAEN